MKIKKIDIICGSILFILIILLNKPSPSNDICITEQQEIICSNSSESLNLYIKTRLKTTPPYFLNDTILLNKKELRDYLGIKSKSSVPVSSSVNSSSV